MSPPFRIRRATPDPALAEALADVLLDCVAGGASIGLHLGDLRPVRLVVGHRWQRCGEIPGYALLPEGGLCSTTVFYRELAG